MREAVREGLGLSLDEWSSACAADWITERSDERRHHFGVELVAGCSDGWKSHPLSKDQPASKHAKEQLAVHYELTWGSLDGCPAGEGATSSELIDACVEISTRIRCWIERVPVM